MENIINDTLYYEDLFDGIQSEDHGKPIPSTSSYLNLEPANEMFNLHEEVVSDFHATIASPPNKTNIEFGTPNTPKSHKIHY